MYNEAKRAPLVDQVYDTLLDADGPMHVSTFVSNPASPSSIYRHLPRGRRPKAASLVVSEETTQQG
jgi:hypothetical protein